MEGSDQSVIPFAAFRIYHLRRCCIGVFRGLDTAKQEMDEVWHEEQSVRVYRKTLVFVGVQLEQGVEQKKLNARFCKDLCCRYLFEHFFHHALCRLVAVTNRILTEIPVDHD